MTTESGVVIDKTALVLRPDERAARAPALRVGLSGLTMAEWFRDQGPGHAALHRQHLPLHPGRLRGLGAARPHAERRRLPADAGDRDGRAAGAHHLDQQGLDHLGAGDLRPGRRPDRPRPGDHVRPPRRHHRALALDHREGHLPGRRPARLDLAHPRPAASSARSTTTSRRRVQQILQRYKELQDIIAILGVDELSRGRQADRRRARARSSGSCRSRSSSPRCSPARAGKYVTLADTIRSFKEIFDGKHDDLPEQAFYMVGDDRRSRRARQAARGGLTWLRARSAP